MEDALAKAIQNRTQAYAIEMGTIIKDEIADNRRKIVAIVNIRDRASHAGQPAVVIASEDMISLRIIRF